MKTFPASRVESNGPDKIYLPKKRLGVAKIGDTYHVFGHGEKKLMDDMLRVAPEYTKPPPISPEQEKRNARLAAIRKKLDKKAPDLTSTELSFLLKLLLERVLP